MLLAALEVEEAIGIELAEVAGRPPGSGEGRLAQVAEQDRAADQHLAILGQAHPHMGQGLADTAGAIGSRPVEADHGRAFGEAVALEHRQPDPCRTSQQVRRHARAAHGDEAELRGAQVLALDGGDQAEQQLRHQDQALGAAEDDAGEQLRPVHPAGALDAQLALGQQGDAGPGQQGRIGPEVLQQHRQRQHGQVMRRCAGAAGGFQFPGHL
ncbi:hypothetical protein D9M68_593960 [compost metagenome]